MRGRGGGSLSQSKTINGNHNGLSVLSLEFKGKLIILPGNDGPFDVSLPAISLTMTITFLSIAMISATLDILV